MNSNTPQDIPRVVNQQGVGEQGSRSRSPNSTAGRTVTIGQHGVSVEQKITNQMNTRTAGVIAVDDGGNSTCVVTKNGVEIYPSVKGLYGVRNISGVSGQYDFIVDYLGEKYVMGDLALYDCAIPLEMHSETKQHLFFDLSVLVSVHQYGFDDNYLVVSVPIRMHNDEEKDGRVGRLKGKHTLTVNGMERTFTIVDVKVAPETAVAFWVNRVKGKSRYIDIGSRTVGYATTIYENGVTRFIDSESGTFFSMGIQALDEHYTPESLGDYIFGKLSKLFKASDDIYILGGGALDERLVGRLREYYPDLRVMENPRMVNSLGMYELGRAVYGIH